MSKKPAKWYLAVIIFLLIVPMCPPFSYYKEFIYSFAFIFILFEGMILTAVLRIQRKPNMIFLWKVITYNVIIVVISIFVIYLLSSFEMHAGRHLQKMLDYFILSAFVLFVLLNFVLLRIIFAVGILRAGLFGLIMGFINAFLVIATTTFCK